MSLIIHPAISRRSFLAGAASAAAAASLPRVTRAAPTPIREFKLTAAPARWPIVGKPHPNTEVWCYGGRIPGPEIRVRQGEPVRIVVENKLEQDTTATSGAQIASGFGNAMEAGMSGRVGNTVTINGAVCDEVPVRAGERVRLRLVNSSLARIMALRFEGHRPVVVAIDGQPCEPHEPEGGRLLLGPAMRIDVMLDMRGVPGRRYRVIDDFYDGLSYWLTQLAYEDKPAVRAHPLDAPLSLPRNPLPEPDLANAERHELRLQGGMMGGGAMMGMGGMMGMGHGASWAINGTSMTGDGHAGMAPLLTFQRGRSCRLRMRNDTAWWHPMHLHGHSFRVLARNGSAVPPMSTETDTKLIALGERFEKLLLEWAPRMRAALAEVRDNTAALAVAIRRNGCDVAQARMSELERDMQPLAEEIIAAPATSLGGLRAKALVALWEALPDHASHEGAFDFPDASRSLFDAVAEMTGLTPMVRDIEARLAADVGRGATGRWVGRH